MQIRALWYNGREAALLLSRKGGYLWNFGPRARGNGGPWGSFFASSLRPGQVVAFRGPLGRRETAFTRGLAWGLGVTGPVTSPTYTIVNEYTGGRMPCSTLICTG